MEFDKQNIRKFVVLSLVGILFLTGIKVYAETAGGINLKQGGLGITTVSEGNILVGSDSNRVTSTSSPTVGYITATSSTASTFQNIIISGTCTGAGCGTGGGGGAGNVATSSAETSTYVPYWTSTSATPATLGSDAGFAYNASQDRLTVTYASTTAISSSGSAWFATSGGNVGIGTVAPQELFHVGAGDDVSGLAATLAIVEQSGDTNIAVRDSNSNVEGMFYAHSSGYVIGGAATNHGYRLRTNNADRVTIDTSGRVGIGTTTPSSGLSIYGSGQTTSALDTDGSLGGSLKVIDSGTAAGNGGAILFGLNNASIGKTFAAIKGLGVNGTSNSIGDLAFSIRSAVADATLTERMIIKTDGKVGIGTTSPYAKLSVVGLTVAQNFFATSTSATSTFAGGLIGGNGSLITQGSNGITSLSALETGNLSVDQDGGRVQAVNFSVVNAGNGIVQSMGYGFNNNASTSLNIYGVADGAGNVTNFGVQVGTSTPLDTRDILTVDGSFSGNATTTISLKAKCWNVQNTSGSWISYYFVGTTQIIENNKCQ